MNPAIYEINLDINAVGSQTALSMRQGENGKILRATLRQGGGDYVIANDCTVVFAAKKPDGTVIFNDAGVENNTAVYAITEQTTAAVGKVECEIRVYDVESRMICSPRFEINVDEKAVSDRQIESTNEVSTLTRLIGEATDLIARVNADLEGGAFTPAFAIGTVESLPSYSEATVTLSGTQKNPILNFGIPRGGNGSEVNHNLLIGLSLPNQHPIKVITGLQDALDGKQPAGDYALKDNVPTQLSELTGDTGHRTVSDAQIDAWNSKLDSVPANSVGPTELTAEAEALFAPHYEFGTQDKVDGSSSSYPEGTIYWKVKSV